MYILDPSDPIFTSDYSLKNKPRNRRCHTSACAVLPLEERCQSVVCNRLPRERRALMILYELATKIPEVKLHRIDDKIPALKAELQEMKLNSSQNNSKEIDGNVKEDCGRCINSRDKKAKKCVGCLLSNKTREKHIHKYNCDKINKAMNTSFREKGPYKKTLVHTSADEWCQNKAEINVIEDYKAVENYPIKDEKSNKSFIDAAAWSREIGNKFVGEFDVAGDSEIVDAVTFIDEMENNSEVVDAVTFIDEKDNNDVSLDGWPKNIDDTTKIEVNATDDHGSLNCLSIIEKKPNEATQNDESYDCSKKNKPIIEVTIKGKNNKMPKSKAFYRRSKRTRNKIIIDLKCIEDINAIFAAHLKKKNLKKNKKDDIADVVCTKNLNETKEIGNCEDLVTAFKEEKENSSSRKRTRNNPSSKLKRKQKKKIVNSRNINKTRHLIMLKQKDCSVKKDITVPVSEEYTLLSKNEEAAISLKETLLSREEKENIFSKEKEEILSSKTEGKTLSSEMDKKSSSRINGKMVFSRMKEKIPSRGMEEKAISSRMEKDILSCNKGENNVVIQSGNSEKKEEIHTIETESISSLSLAEVECFSMSPDNNGEKVSEHPVVKTETPLLSNECTINPVYTNEDSNDSCCTIWATMSHNGELSTIKQELISDDELNNNGLDELADDINCEDIKEEITFEEHDINVEDVKIECLKYDALSSDDIHNTIDDPIQDLITPCQQEMGLIESDLSESGNSLDVPADDNTISSCSQETKIEVQCITIKREIEDNYDNYKEKRRNLRSQNSRKRRVSPEPSNTDNSTVNQLDFMVKFPRRVMKSMSRTRRMKLCCMKCRRTFDNEVKLAEHVRLHSHTFKCGICNQVFICDGALRGHMRVHLGERPYDCNMCKSSKKLRRAHMKAHHPSH
ncbi:hypothetical protein C0J52_10574 [Blattella germanica]|nr:hypothetical protein C0J52_10574 [Blattella germanica]